MVEKRLRIITGEILDMVKGAKQFTTGITEEILDIGVGLYNVIKAGNSLYEFYEKANTWFDDINRIRLLSALSVD